MNEQQPNPVVISTNSSPPVMRSVQPGEVPPGRVQVALEFLGMLTYKTQKRGFANDTTIEVVEGTVLTKAENNAQATACNLLNDYFLGKTKPTYWERQPKQRRYVEQYDGPCDDGDCEECHNVPKQYPTSYLKCFVCGPGNTNPNCDLCCGTGRIMVTPVEAGDVR